MELNHTDGLETLENSLDLLLQQYKEALKGKWPDGRLSVEFNKDDKAILAPITLDITIPDVEAPSLDKLQCLYDSATDIAKGSDVVIHYSDGTFGTVTKREWESV